MLKPIHFSTLLPLTSSCLLTSMENKSKSDSTENENKSDSHGQSAYL